MAYREEDEAVRAALAAKDEEIARLRQARAQEPPPLPSLPSLSPGGPMTRIRRDLELEADRELIRLKIVSPSSPSNRRAAGPNSRSPR